MTEYPFHAATALDIELWSRKPVWEKSVLPEILLGYQPRWRPQTRIDLDRLNKMKELTEAANIAGELFCLRDVNGNIPPGAKYPPRNFAFPAVVVAWSRTRKIPVAPRFEELAEAVLLAAAQSLKEPTAGSQATREKNTLLKMIYAMGRKKFGYNPDQPQTEGEAVKKIESALLECGFTTGPSAQTIRNKLREASEIAKEGDAN